MSVLGTCLLLGLVVVVVGPTLPAMAYLRGQRSNHEKFRLMLQQFRTAIGNRSLAEIQLERRYLLLAREAVEQEMNMEFGYALGCTAIAEMLRILDSAELDAETIEPEESGLRPGVRPFAEELRRYRRTG
jgi:hypothetical protein